MQKWLVPILAGLLGVAAGLLYGWVLNPVKFVDTTPASLRADYRSDYVLMVAEAYHADRDAEQAGRRLAIFGSEAPTSIASAALSAAEKFGYSAEDLDLMRELLRGLQASQPAVPTTVGTP